MFYILTVFMWVFYNFRVFQNHLQGLLKHTLLVPKLEVSDSVYLGEVWKFTFPGMTWSFLNSWISLFSASSSWTYVAFHNCNPKQLNDGYNLLLVEIPSLPELTNNCSVVFYLYTQCCWIVLNGYLMQKMTVYWD